MKQFFRTVAGKSILFILCVVSIVLSIASIIAASWMIGGNFYTRTEEEIFSKISYHHVLVSASDIVNENIPFIERIHRNKEAKKASDDEVSNPTSTSAGKSTTIPNSDLPLVVKEEGNLIFEVLLHDQIILKSESSSPNTKWLRSFELTHRDMRKTHGAFDQKQEFPTYTLHLLRDREKADIYIRVAFVEGFPHTDSLSLLHSLLGTAYALRYWIYPIGILFGIIALACFITLLSVAARRKNSEELHPGPLNNIPFDLFVFVSYLGFLIVYNYSMQSHYRSEVALIIFVALFGISFISATIGICISAAARIKQKTFVKNNLVYILPVFLWKMCLKFVHIALSVFHSMKFTPKVTAITLLAFFVEFILLQISFDNHFLLFFLWLLRQIILILLLIHIAYSMHRLRKAGAALAGGNLGYQVDTKGLHFDFKEHAQDLNSIAKGMAIAIEDRLKSERMKTELITNVSHDIKTPLTSIVNYSQLLHDTSATDHPDVFKIKEYSDILIKHSDKLKRLIEDLVEASKASSGNLELSLAPADASLYLSQICGEYADRMKASGLTLVVNAPSGENPNFIMADGRRMWRIFDNVMNNICKYSLSGTRVYLGLKYLKKDAKEYALFSFKNTSRDALNLSAEELFERFTRGDKSRNTEGNGLGLSISKSLVELQGGNMEIDIDGDLFKVSVRFPIV